MTDFDLWLIRVVVVAAVGTYFGTSFYAAFALGGWGGAVLLAGLMVPVLLWVLVKSSQLRDAGGLLVEQTGPAQPQGTPGSRRVFND